MSIQSHKILRFLAQIASPLVLLGCYAYVFRLFDRYDWEQPFTKLLCFGALFLGIHLLSRKASGPPVSRWVYVVETAALCVVLVFVAGSAIDAHGEWFSRPPRVDVGYVTQDAAQMFFGEFENPYSSKTLNDLYGNEDFAGFKYGPVLLLAYWPSVLLPDSGFDLANGLYLILTAVILFWLSYDLFPTRLARVATCLFILCALLVPRRMWYELFVQGVVDLFAVLPILAALLCVKHRRWFLAGLATGLCFSAKFGLAIFGLFFIRRDLKPSYFWGGLLGLLPLAGFLLWDYEALLNNYFLVKFTKDFDSTSLHSISPAEVHFLFPAIQLIAVVWVVLRNFNRPIEYRSIAVQYTLLLLVFDVTYKQMHLNHLLWFIPLCALTLGWYRYEVVNVFRELWAGNQSSSEARTANSS
jgi:hypothetical protein